MEHNPRVIELAHLPDAIRAMGDFDEPQAAAASRMAGRVRGALRLDAVVHDDAVVLADEAKALGVIVLDGISGSSGTSPTILVADHERLKRLGAGLELRGVRSMGAAIRQTLAAYERETSAKPATG